MKAEPGQEHVSTTVCRDRHGTSKWMFGVLTGLMSVLMAGITYSVNSAHEAMRTANATATMLESHVATEAEMRRLIVERLDDLKQDLRDNRALLNEILTSGKGQRERDG